MPAERAGMMPLVGGLVGAVFCLWISGLRTIDPTETRWVMQLDWRIHFLGWHLFRGEPWHWPPGRLDSYFAPLGTTIGFTDSIPLVAFLLKPLAGVLPMPFQYLGLWVLICFTLQGAVGVALMAVWTRSRVVQLLGAMLFILMPTLLIRVGHPALCSHWILLSAILLYVKTPAARAAPLIPQAVLGLIAGLVHPYLAVMTLAILAALAVRAMNVAATRAAAGLAAALLMVVVGWWASGLFTVGGAANLASEGLGNYSMNLLAPVTPSGWSTLLPELPLATQGQTYEGFQYFGAGALALFVVAAAVGLRQPAALPWRTMAPLLVAALVCAIYALSPRVTFGNAVLLDATTPALDRFAIFRATGRFFWPMAYLLLASALALVASRLPPRAAAIVLTAVVVLQLIDLKRAHAERRVTSRSDGFHAWQNPLSSPAWALALPHYRHIVIVPPRQCGSAPIGFEGAAYLAGAYGLTINSAEVARTDEMARRRYCSELAGELNAGRLRHDSVYLMDPTSATHTRAAAAGGAVCGPIDVVTVCVTPASYHRWQAAARLE